eukprot:m.537350 g.537350  ORF g.537350 m.537350 type:complete len:84 (+) comp22076_c0_seq3:1976-2227(+)
MANSTVFITGIGSGSHIGWYLPRGGTMIRLSPAFGLHASHLEWHLFNYMPHFQVGSRHCSTHSVGVQHTQPKLHSQLLKLFPS